MDNNTALTQWRHGFSFYVGHVLQPFSYIAGPSDEVGRGLVPLEGFPGSDILVQLDLIVDESREGVHEAYLPTEPP